MYQVLARKYRPQKFGDLLGQEHVRTTIANAISQGRIAHGYIFAGQRGTGKTTVARILARCLNCEQGPTAEPCGKCASCVETSAGNAVDVIEIDAASNRGINEMRELRENIKYRPARDRYKIFIIDEAHQITNEAFNALLKTLEEPPEWVVFVLCTTEAHKIPTTIASRCQQFAFRSVDFTEVIARMKEILEAEGVTADAEVLAVLAQSGEGSVRDSLSALDQAIACCGTKLEAAEVRRLLGMFSLESLHAVTDALGKDDSRAMLEIVAELERDGRNLQHFCRELSRFFRNLLVVKVAGPGGRLIAASQPEQKRMAEIAGAFSEEDLTRYLQITLDLFRELQFSLQPRLHLEMGLLKLVHAGRLMPIEEALAAAGQGGGSAPAPAPRKKTVAAPPPAPPKPGSAPQLSGWQAKLHGALREQKQTFAADAVEHSRIEETGGELRFTAAREFGLALRSKELHKAVEQVAGRPLKVVFIATDSPADAAASANEPKPDSSDDEVAQRALADPEVKHIRDTFPGSEVRTVRNLKQ